MNRANSSFVIGRRARLAAIAALTALSFVGAGVAHAARPDPAAGEELAKTACASCHGLDGVSPEAAYPNLKGQKVKYLVQQLEAFQSGLRTSPEHAAPVAGELSKGDIKNLAAYYSGLSDEASIADASPPDFAAGEEKAKMICAACHGLDGISLVAAYPNLRGQKVDYLIQQLEAFRSGERESLQLMNPVASQLTDDDIKNLAAFFSRMEPVSQE